MDWIFNRHGASYCVTGVGVGVGAGDGLDVGDALGVGDATGDGVGLGVGLGVGFGDDDGLGEGEATGVGVGKGDGVGDGAGVDFREPYQKAAAPITAKTMATIIIQTTAVFLFSTLISAGGTIVLVSSI